VSPRTPWIIGVTDLHVVIDVLYKPAQLVGYLDFRDRWTRDARLVIADELELLALFLHQVDLAAKLRSLCPSAGRCPPPRHHPAGKSDSAASVSWRGARLPV
jgi:hypothetical protein